MSLIWPRAVLYVFVALAIVAAATWGYRTVFGWGAASRQPEIDQLEVRLRTVKLSLDAANEEAQRRAQDSARRAKEIEDDRVAQLDRATRQEAESAAGLRALADDYERRVRAALEARACRGGEVRRPGLSRAPQGGPPATAAAGPVHESLARDLVDFALMAETLAGQYRICHRAVTLQQTIVRAQ